MKIKDQYYQYTNPDYPDFEVTFYFSTTPVPMQAKVYPPHVDDFLEFYVLIEGDVSFMVENKLYKLSAGDAIITKPNEIHNCIVNSTSLHKHCCFWFNEKSQSVFKDFISHSYGENNLISPSEEKKERLFSLLESLQQSSEKEDEYSQFYLILEFLDIFRKSMQKSSFNAYLPIPDVLKRILDDIQENLTKIENLQYFTEKYFLSQSTLNRLFHTHLHTTPKLYLESKRLAYSRVLLKEGKSVLTACMQSGFSDYSNYIRLFKKRFSITPKQYQGEI